MNPKCCERCEEPMRKDLSHSRGAYTRCHRDQQRLRPNRLCTLDSAEYVSSFYLCTSTCIHVACGVEVLGLWQGPTTICAALLS